MSEQQTRRKSIRSGTLEPAQGTDTWLEYDSVSEKSTIFEGEILLDSASTKSFQVSQSTAFNIISSTVENLNCVNPNYLSQLETEILRSNTPVESNESEEITVLNNRGVWINREEISKWNGNINEYLINEDANPEIIEKKVQKALNYIQELAVRYLRPPTPPQPGDIIITQVNNFFI